MEAKIYKIDLQDFRTPKANVFIGRKRGQEVRERSKIDEEEAKVDSITIVIPETIASINPSFLEEFLFNVVRKLGNIGFRQKIKFINDGAYKIDSDLEESIDRILTEENALA
ncbi:MAG: DUF4325 domain-containing protein [bacterium]